jgi:hypothetical protein
MNNQTPTPRHPNWAWPRWFSAYLILCGVAVAIAIVQCAIPGRREDHGMGKAATLIPVSVALDVLAAIGIVLAVKRRSILVRESPVRWIVGSLLIALGTFAFAIFIFFGCLAASNY